MPPMRVRGYLAALGPVVRQQNEDELFREYLFESIRQGVQGRFFQQKWADIINRPTEDSRDPEERLEEFTKKAGLVKRGGETT